jgi:hypothetical protein
MMEMAIPATKVDRMIDESYVKTGEKLVDAAGPSTTLKVDSYIDLIYMKRGDTFVKLLGPNEAKINRELDNLYIKSERTYLKFNELPDDKQQLIVEEIKEAHIEKFKYLKQPAAIFDQSAEDFFRSISEYFVRMLKYPYAIVMDTMDFLLGTEEENPPTIHERAEIFEHEGINLLYQTSNVSGISVAVIIMVTMLSLYLVSIL